ncbi:MAG: hypothetical protein Q8R12_02635 [bacterium]|nr:hypothetical protein [bacterium]
MKPSRTNILTTIFILIILILGYVWYSYIRSRPATLVRSVSSTLPVHGKEFLTLLKTLESIKLDTSLLQEATFQNLKEGPSLPETPSARGRLNPFLPIR